MRARAAVIMLFPALISGCALIAERGPLPPAIDHIRALDDRLGEAEHIWFEAIDDPYTERVLRNSYVRMQDFCRECANRPGGFETVEEKELCDRVRDPFVIYYNRLAVKANKLEEQIEIKAGAEDEEPNTVAYEYRRRPSSENLEKLRAIFHQVHRYYVGWPYTWTRYINKYPFQRSRADHFGKAFLDRDREYRKLASSPDADREELRIARARAEFAFKRLKDEYITNDLPPAGEVNAFYLARNLDDYHRLLEEEERLASRRRAEGRSKEVVILVHGLSETRASWGRLPELLAGEDTVNDQLGKTYFKVYVFSYDTVEDSKSVEGFKNELAGFIADIIRDENVERVHLIGHSFGAVLCLKYIIHEADEFLKDIDRSEPGAVAEALIKAYADGRYRQKVKSFISIAGSISGSETANIAGDRFIPKKQLFRRSLPLFRGGVPGYGDIQVRENQIGSAVNLTSFQRLDTECPLWPQDLLKFARRSETDAIALRAESIPVLCIIGDPVKIQSLFRKEGILKMGEAWDILRIDGLLRIFGSFRREEDDGLVKGYSANINHIWLLRSGEDIGYRRASVRYNAHGHFSICRVDSREHPTYRYIVSFLSGNLSPQLEAGRFSVHRFATLLRVFPEGVNPQTQAEAFFLPEERVVYMKDRKMIIPGLAVEEAGLNAVEPGSAPAKVALGKPQWNEVTGVCFREGRVVGPAPEAWVTYRLRAKGYQETLLSMPVRPGQASYAVDVLLKKEMIDEYKEYPGDSNSYSKHRRAVGAGIGLLPRQRHGQEPFSWHIQPAAR